MRRWVIWLRSPVGSRAAVAVVLCVLTAALQFSDIRYQTSRSSLVPGMFAPGWGVSRLGVGLMREDLSIALITRNAGQAAPFMVRDVPNFRGADAVRIGIEARTSGVVPGSEFWQAARVLLWSYDGAGKRLRYLPYEVLRLDGTSDWQAGHLIVPVVDAVNAMRIVIVQAGETGTMIVRGITVDAVTERRFYGIARYVLIGLWVLAALWAAYPVVRRWSRARVAAAVLLVATLAGALAPQPFMSNALQDAGESLSGVVDPARHALLRLAKGSVAAVAPQSIAVVLVEAQPPSAPAAQPGQPPSTPAAGPAPPPGQPGPSAATPSVATTTLLADFSPRFDSAEAHLIAFALLAVALPFAFPGVRLWQLFAGLLLLGLAIEMVQSFYVSRAAEWDDIAQDLIGAAIGLGLAAGFLFLRRSAKKQPA
jgi:hypothetical protein